MQESAHERRRSRSAARSGWLLAFASIGVIAAACLGFASWEAYRQRTQMQNDARVARVWLAGVTFGPEHHLERGSSLQKWLNERHITLLGNYEMLSGQFGGEPGSLELWLNYESYLADHPDLECHRVRLSGTAFEDDLGQPYHGFLDIHGKTVGVYLPGYDHSARELRCTLQWMPRRPAAPYPVSRPTVFTVRLPHATRLLPAAAGLPRTVALTRNGITVTITGARLGPFKHANGAVGQRDITFHMKIDGGHMASDNVIEMDLPSELPPPPGQAGTRGGRILAPTLRMAPALSGAPAQRHLLNFVSPAYVHPLSVSDPYGISMFYQPAPPGGKKFSVSDPYGVSMIPAGESVTPLITRETIAAARKGKGIVYVVPVNGAGKGTDAIRVRFDALPDSPGDRRHAVSPAELTPFDVVVPVQTGDEI